MKRLTFNKIASLGLVAAAAVAMTSCDKEKLLTDSYPEAYPTTEITFDVSEVLPLAVGMDSTLVYTVGPEVATDKTIIFSSSNPAVATVDANGKITAVAVGEATVSAVPVIGFGADASVLVQVIPEIIKAQEVIVTNTTELGEEGNIYESDELQLACEILPADHTYSHVTWTSDDPSVATVDKNGLVQCVKEGDAVIRCHTHDKSGVSGVFRFHIYRLTEVESLEIAPIEGELCITQGATPLNVTYYPEGATIGSVQWESSDETVVSVKRGVITPKGFGSATVTATAPSGKQASIGVTVASGWYIWDGNYGWGSWTAGNAVPGTEVLHVPFSDPNGGKWRNDLKYSGLVNPTNLLPLDWGNYPVIALRVKNLKAGGNNSMDAVDVISGVNSNNLKAVRTELSDGSALLVWNAAAKYNSAYTEMRVFNLKIADIPNDRYSAADLANAYYDVMWIRTFKSDDDAKAFAEAQIAEGK